MHIPHSSDILYFAKSLKCVLNYPQDAAPPLIYLVRFGWVCLMIQSLVYSRKKTAEKRLGPNIKKEYRLELSKVNAKELCEVIASKMAPIFQDSGV